jgi:hypothetical protein
MLELNFNNDVDESLYPFIVDQVKRLVKKEHLKPGE